MSENESPRSELEELFDLKENEKEGAKYIGGVVLLIALIIILASLTHVILHP